MSLIDGEKQTLQEKLEKAEAHAHKAAQYGLQLLDDKIELQKKLEDHQKQMTDVIERFEQEKYSLQREVELKGRVLDSLRSEFEFVKNQQNLLLEQQKATLERSHEVEVCDLKSKMENMRADLDEARLLEKQMRHKLELQSQTLSSKTEELRKLMECSYDDTRSSEFTDLQKKMIHLESSVVVLEQELQESQCKEQQLQLNNTIIQRQLEALSCAKEEKEREVVSLYNALEKSREANQDLQIQLVQALQQAQDPNSKGNSLFSEVEDRRVEMERQLISMKVQHQSLQKQYAFTKQQMLRTKVQISNLMQLQGTRADPAQLERLQFMLSEKNNEIEILMGKVQKLEKMEMTLEDQSSISTSKPNEFVDETYYIDLLKMQISNSKKVAETLKDELSMARMKAFSESQRVLELERKLFGAEKALKQGQSDNIKLQVKLDELQMKYEPEEVKKARTQKRKREKLPVNIPEESQPQSHHCPKETAVMESDCSKTPEMITHPPPCSPGKPTDLAHSSDCNSDLLGDSKSVHFQDTPVSVPDSPRSSVMNCSSTTELLKKNDEEKKRTAVERKGFHGPIRVDPQNTMERQCAQQ